MRHSVLFICSANICRSPMAMGLLQAIVAQQDADWRVESAGVWAGPGNPAAKYTQEVLDARGIDLQSHRSRPVTREMIADFRLILVMEQNHKEALSIAFPEFAGRIYLLTEMIAEHGNIVDPIGGTLADFEVTAGEIDEILRTGFRKIVELSAPD